MQHQFIKKIHYRAKYRGVKELDMMMEKLLHHDLPSLCETELTLMADFLIEDEQLLYNWIIKKDDDYPAKYKNIIQKFYQY